MQTTVLRGVNLGGWLVLEKWMTPSLFTGMNAVDEHTFCHQATEADMERLRHHHNTFITEADIAWLHDQGITAVRVPLGYWHFGDQAPFVATTSQLEDLFDWTRRRGMQVLLSIHAPVHSPNGQDHSGRSGAVTWTTPAAARVTLQFARRLTERYGNQPNLYGIEALNEPAMSAVPRRLLTGYYRSAYTMLRRHAPAARRLVFSDGFQPLRWNRVLPSAQYPGSVLDVHHYQCYTALDKWLSITGHVCKLRYWIRPQLWFARRAHPVIVGEWSLALDARSLRGLDAAGTKAAYQAYGQAQLELYDRQAGWFYWSYKTEDDGPWNFRASLSAGRLPAWSDTENE